MLIVQVFLLKQIPLAKSVNQLESQLYLPTLENTVFSLQKTNSNRKHKKNNSNASQCLHLGKIIPQALNFQIRLQSLKLHLLHFFEHR